MQSGEPEDKEEREAYFEALEKFYSDIVEKFDIVDPLDRKVPQDDPDEAEQVPNQAIKVEDLKQ